MESPPRPCIVIPRTTLQRQLLVGLSYVIASTAAAGSGAKELQSRCEADQEAPMSPGSSGLAMYALPAERSRVRKISRGENVDRKTIFWTTRLSTTMN